MTFIPTIVNAVRRNCFEIIKSHAHFSYNVNLTKTDKFAKMHPWLAILNKRFLPCAILKKRLCVDERIMPCWGKRHAKQFLRGKRYVMVTKCGVCVGLGQWFITGEPLPSSGPPHEFGSTTGSISTTWDSGFQQKKNISFVKLIFNKLLHKVRDFEKRISALILFENAKTDDRRTLDIGPQNIYQIKSGPQIQQDWNPLVRVSNSIWTLLRCHIKHQQRS